MASGLGSIINLPVDPRTQNLAFLYSDPIILLFVYVVLVSIDIYSRKLSYLSKKFNLRPILLIYNGCMFGSYGTGLLVGLFALDGGQKMFDCSELDTESSDPKLHLQLVVCVVFQIFKILKFLEPAAYRLCGEPPPFSKIQQFDQFMAHLGGSIVMRFHPGNFFALVVVLDGLFCLVFYSRQTLVFARELPQPGPRWNSLINLFLFTERVGPLIQALWGLSNPQCTYLRPLLGIQLFLTLCISVPCFLYESFSVTKSLKGMDTIKESDKEVKED